MLAVRSITGGIKVKGDRNRAAANGIAAATSSPDASSSKPEPALSGR